MKYVKFQHPKTKRVHTIEDNPKYARILLAKGFKRVQESAQPAEEQQAADSWLDGLNKSQLVDKAKDLAVPVPATARVGEIRSAILEQYPTAPEDQAPESAAEETEAE